MSKVDDISTLLSLLQGSRDKALQCGDYETSIDEHDQAIRLCTKLQKSCNSSMMEQKLENLKERCKIELKALKDLHCETNELQSSNTARPSQIDKASVAVVDPDVWPPPTPLPPNRRNEDNIPAWAKIAENDPSRHLSHQSKKPDVPWRGNFDDNKNQDRIRRDRDGVPENRRR